MELSRVQLDVRPMADGRVVVRLAGELDIAESEGVRRFLTAEAQTSTVVAVDLVGLSFIDLSGVRALLDAQRVATARGSTLVLVSPPRCLTMLVGLMEPGPMTFSEDRLVVGEPASRADERPGSVGRRVPARHVRVNGARAWRAPSGRPSVPPDPSCSPDDSA